MESSENCEAEMEKTLMGLGFSRDDFNRPTSEFSELNGVESAVVYQRAAAKRVITEKGMSEEMKRSLCGRKLKGRSGSGILLCLA